jgi:hypothetical protein
MNKTQEEFPDKPMFDYGPDERPPFGGQANKSSHIVVVTKPRAEIAIDERVAALETNPYFLCLGYRDDQYFFRRKSLDRYISTKTFSTPWILGLAPLGFWEEWSGTKGKRFPQTIIMDALIRLSQRTGRFVYPYEGWLAAESTTR